MAKKTLTTRLDPDTKQQIEKYADEHGIGQTEAARRLIRGGLDAEADDTPDTGGYLDRIAQDQVFAPSLLVAIVGWLMPYVALALNAGTLPLYSTFVLASALMFGGVLVAGISLVAQLALARPLRGLVGFSTPEADA
jgi:hypothetical protein